MAACVLIRLKFVSNICMVGNGTDRFSTEKVNLNQVNFEHDNTASSPNTIAIPNIFNEMSKTDFSEGVSNSLQYSRLTS